MTYHDASRWAEKFKDILEKPEFHLASFLRSEVTVVYWLMNTIGDILEVGAGSGRGCIAVKRMQPSRRVVATDIDAEMCNIITEYAKLTNTDIEVRQADVFELPFKDNEFGAVFSSGLLEHFEDAEIVRAIKEQLRVAELAIITVPTDHYYYIRGGKEYGDERLILKLRWLGLFTEAGFIREIAFKGERGEETSITVILSKDIE